MAKTVLIADDDEKQLQALGAHLQRQGCRVVCARDALSAVLQAHAYPPELILLGDGMPARDGSRVYDRLQSSAQTFHIPVVFLLKAAQIPQLRSASSFRHLRVLSKPVDPNRLTVLVNEILPGFLIAPI